MTINRRVFLKSLATTLATTVAAGASHKLAFAAASSRFGDWQIDVVSDGFIELPVARALPGASDDELQHFLGEETVASGSYRVACNLVVLRKADQVVLIDAGAGPSFLDSTGVAGEALSSLGIEADQVTHVLFTHAHPDHLWGVKDDFDEVLFTNAAHWISATEWNYWTDPATVSRISADRQFFAVGAKDRLALVAEQSDRFQPEQEVLPGIVAIDTSGHTPGHVAFQVNDGDNSLVIVGDALTNVRFSFEQPNRITGSDQDGQMAAESRLKLLDRLVAQKSELIGFHFPHPGTGTVERNNGAYRFVSS